MDLVVGFFIGASFVAGFCVYGLWRLDKQEQRAKHAKAKQRTEHKMRREPFTHVNKPTIDAWANEYKDYKKHGDHK